MITDAMLPPIFMGLLAIAVLAYAVLDGYDLGVGILLPPRNEAHRNTMIASIGPFWDANETWLVLAVGILLIAFPTAHGMVLQALYIPATLMLIGLILRGVAFDFRAKVAQGRKSQWDKAFKYGSLLASFSQGYMLGLYVMGLENTWFAHSFALLSGFGVVAAYCFIGACWLVMKTEGDLQQKALLWAKRCLLVCALGIAAVSLANLFVHVRIWLLWTTGPTAYLLWALPISCFGLLGLCELKLRTLSKEPNHNEWQPFIIAIAIFWLCFAGLAISYYPYVVPGKLTIWDATSAPESLRFILYGAVVVIPCILAYTVLAYRIFWGKAQKLSYY